MNRATGKGTLGQLIGLGERVQGTEKGVWETGDITLDRGQSTGDKEQRCETGDRRRGQKTRDRGKLGDKTKEKKKKNFENERVD